MAFDDYQIQVSLEMQAMGDMPLAFVVAHKDPDGAVSDSSEIRVQYVLEPPVSLGKVKAKVLRLMKHIEAGTLPDKCGPDQYPCPFYLTLHDNNSDEGSLPDGGISATVEQIRQLEHQAGLYIQGRELEHKGLAVKRAASDEIKAIFDVLGRKGGKIKAGKYQVVDMVQKMKEHVIKAHEKRYPRIIEVVEDPFESFDRDRTEG